MTPDSSTSETPTEPFDPIMAQQELLRIQQLEVQTAEDNRRAVYLIRQLRRTNTGPSAPKKAKKDKTPKGPTSLDELI